MRHLLVSLSFLCMAALATDALAQPRPVRRRARPTRGHSDNRGQGGRGGYHMPTKEEMCASRRNILTEKQRQLDDMRAELAGVDAELAQLKRRMDDLNRRKSSLARRTSVLDGEVRSEQSNFKSNCQANENCTQYDRMASALDKQGKVVQQDLDNVRSEMMESRAATGKLRQGIEPLRKEYQDLQCNNLVPGETSQDTIDRCSSIFSDWNRLQARLNRENDRLASLKSRYEQLLARMRNVESRAKGYEAYLSRNCSTSSETQAMKGYGRVRERAEQLGRELDKVIDDVASLRGLQINVTTK